MILVTKILQNDNDIWNAKNFHFSKVHSFIEKSVRNDKNKDKNLCAEKLLIRLADLTVAVLIYVLGW